MKEYDVIIIGGGVVGCAAAYECSKYGFSTAILEKENDIATGSTKANSALIHSGCDPEPGTLMAKFNVRGNKLSHEISKKLDVPFRETGSFVIAFSEEERFRIQHLYENSKKNGVRAEIWEKERILEKEPSLNPDIVCGLWTPSCGIISPWEFSAAMLETAVLNGVDCFLSNKVLRINQLGGQFIVKTTQDKYAAKYVVNAAGLFADKVYEMVGGSGFSILPSRGEYYLFDKTMGDKVESVIFQCPTKVGKGIVVGPTIHGNLFAGPDSHPAERRDDVATHADEMAMVRQTALKSVPSLDFGENIRNFAGLRAIAGEDFIVEESAVPNFINAAGIKSPGLTSAPAIAERLVEILGGLGMRLEKREGHVDERKVVRFHELTRRQQAEAIKQNPAYGTVVCRCQTITEGEIIDILKRPVTPPSIDAVKRRSSAGMGRCQGGFCEPRIHDIMARTLGVEMKDIMQDIEGTYIVTGETKED